jgi:hypothetical protein
MPRDETLRGLSQGNEQTSLFDNFVLSIVPETRRLGISELQEENMVEHHHA